MNILGCMSFMTECRRGAMCRLVAGGTVLSLTAGHLMIAQQARRPIAPEAPVFEFVRMGNRIVASETRLEDPQPITASVGYLTTSPNKTSQTVWVLSEGVFSAPPGKSEFIAIAHDDVPVLAVEIVDSASGTVLKSFSKDAEAVNPGDVRASLWSIHNYTYPPTTVRYQVRFAASCTAKVFSGTGATGLANTIVDRVSTASGSGTSASSGTVAQTQAPNELLIGVIGVEGPGDDPPGTFLNTYTSYYDDGKGMGTWGQGASSNITLHVGVRTVNTIGEYFVTKTGLANRDWAALVATYRGLQQ